MVMPTFLNGLAWVNGLFTICKVEASSRSYVGTATPTSTTSPLSVCLPVSEFPKSSPHVSNAPAASFSIYI